MRVSSTSVTTRLRYTIRLDPAEYFTYKAGSRDVIVHAFVMEFSGSDIRNALAHLPVVSPWQAYQLRKDGSEGRMISPQTYMPANASPIIDQAAGLVRRKELS